jgi:hypothetical protein
VRRWLSLTGARAQFRKAPAPSRRPRLRRACAGWSSGVLTRTRTSRAGAPRPCGEPESTWAMAPGETLRRSSSQRGRRGCAHRDGAERAGTRRGPSRRAHRRAALVRSRSSAVLPLRTIPLRPEPIMLASVASDSSGTPYRRHPRSLCWLSATTWCVSSIVCRVSATSASTRRTRADRHAISDRRLWTSSRLRVSMGSDSPAQGTKGEFHSWHEPKGLLR